jgi:hypothetical protein
LRGLRALSVVGSVQEQCTSAIQATGCARSVNTNDEKR